jgi:peptidoglycan/LPS O-acetylase OafA/YrhL
MLRKAGFPEIYMRHSANLDFLRTFAVSSVLLQHLIPTMAAHAGFHNAAIIEFTSHIGVAGVIAFFVHTSLVLMYSIERISRSAKWVTMRFYVRRLFRIYPLSVFCITLALMFHVPNITYGNADIITARVVLANLFLVQNFVTGISVLGPLWSLPYEVEMYLVLPTLYFLALKKRGVIYLCSLLAFFSCLGVLLFWFTGGHLNIAAYIPCFLCGVLCYSLRDRIHPFIPSTFWPLFVLLLFSGFCLAKPNMRINQFWIGWIFCLLLGLGINTFHDSTNKKLNYVSYKIALYSYGMYLLHTPVLYLVFIVFGIKNLIFGPVLYVVVTMVASFITYHFLESPFIEFGRKLSSRPPQTVALLPSEEA